MNSVFLILEFKIFNNNISTLIENTLYESLANINIKNYTAFNSLILSQLVR